jgi:L-amino acid N-acyltransferase YncA
MPRSQASRYTIRDASSADLDAVQAIYAHHVRHGLASFEETPPDLLEMQRRYRVVLAVGLPYLVTELDGKVRGYAYAGPYRTRPAYRFSLEDTVYVEPGYEGRGLGSALLGALVARCEELGYRRMVAVIGDSDNHPSIRLHARLGFRKCGVIPSVGFKFGRWVDTVLMERPLGPGDTRLPD